MIIVEFFWQRLISILSILSYYLICVQTYFSLAKTNQHFFKLINNLWTLYVFFFVLCFCYTGWIVLNSYTYHRINDVSYRISNFYTTSFITVLMLFHCICSLFQISLFVLLILAQNSLWMTNSNIILHELLHLFQSSICLLFFV